MKISVRGWLVIATFAAIVVVIALANAPWLSAAEAPEAQKGQLSEESLGLLLKAMGLEPKKVDKRYDFSFRAIHGEAEWDLSMTAVLSQDTTSIWVMAWLDELPRSAADVPRTALLRLLADNDRMGNGKFFAYVAGNRRFVLQRVIANHNISTASFRGVLQDLGGSVVDTHDHWSINNWNGKPTVSNVPASGNTAPAGQPPVRSADNQTKFSAPIRN